MSLEIVKQNAKSLMESIYEYERLLNDKAPEKKLKKTRDYAMKMIANISDAVKKEREKLNGK